LALPEAAKHWSLISLLGQAREDRSKIVTHAHYTTFQMAEVAVPSQLFVEMLRLTDQLRPRMTQA
jgi:hypothetical protein